MATTPQDLNFLTEEVSGNLMYGYEQVLASQELWWQRFTGTTDVTPDFAINYNFLESRTQLEEGLRGQGPQYKRTQGETTRIPLRKWENAIAADIFDVAADRFNQIIAVANQIGAEAARKPQDLMIEAFNNGDTAAFLMFDGVNLYDNAHPKGGTTFDNLLGTLPLNQANLQTAMTAMRRFPSDEGALSPLDLMATDLWIPPDLTLTADEIINNTLKPTVNFNTENQLKGRVQSITDARITDVDDWGLMSSQLFVKPFLHIKHRDFGEPRTIPKVSDTDENVIEQDELRWHTKFFMTVFPSRPEFHLKVVN